MPYLLSNYSSFNGVYLLCACNKVFKMHERAHSLNRFYEKSISKTRMSGIILGTLWSD